MDIATMTMLNNLNILNINLAIQQAGGIITIIQDEKEYEDMDGTMLDEYMGKECTVSLFNEVGAIKGKLMDADTQWVKVETPKKGTQLINRNMIRNLTFSGK